MRLSIFNFSRIAAVLRLPASQWAWLLLVAMLGGLTYVKCVKTITNTYRWQAPQYSLVRDEIGEQTEVVVLASSHGFAAVNSSYMDAPLVNLSLNSGNYQVHELLLRSHLDSMPNLRYAVIELENTCLALDRLSGTRDFRVIYELGAKLEHFPKSEWWKRQQRFLDHDLVQPVVFSKRITPYELIYKRQMFYSADKKAEIRGKDYVKEVDPVPLNRRKPGERVPGHGGQLARMDREKLDKIAAIELKPDIVTESRLQNNLAAFKNILVLLEERDIKPIFIRFPTTYAYSRWQTEAWLKIAAEQEQLMQETYGDAFMLWEFNFEPDFSYEDFGDSQHLNKWGAIKFSQMLDKKILALPGITPRSD